MRKFRAFVSVLLVAGLSLNLNSQTSLASEVLQNNGPVISAGNVNTCAISEAGVIRCWGSNKFQQNNVPSDLGRVSKVATGFAHTCVVTELGSVRCWGTNEGGETEVPVDLDKVTQISAGSGHTCVVTELGSVRCWGDDPINKLTKVPSDLERVVQISAGSFHTCAVTESGLVRCWGTNWYGQNNVPSDLGNLNPSLTGDLNKCVSNVTELKTTQVDDFSSTRPLITGTPTVGQSLRATNGLWPSGTKLCAFWIVGDRSAAMSKVSTYKIQGSDLGLDIRYAVVGTKNGVSSIQISDVVTATQAIFTKPKTPIVNGVARVGAKLSAVSPAWESVTTYKFQWLRNGEQILGANSLSYVPKPSDLGASLSLKVCGSKPFYIDLCLVSAEQIVVQGVMSKIGTVIFVGKLHNVGAVLTGASTPWMTGVALQSQWLLNGIPIPEANGRTLVVEPRFKGSVITYQLTATLDGYQTVVKSSLGKRVP